jgi:uncharacterized protein YbbC (DUF1343 family)
MIPMIRTLLFSLLLGISSSFHWLTGTEIAVPTPPPLPIDKDIIPAAHQFFKYAPYVKGKRLGLVVNHTSTVGGKHLIDDLIQRDCQVKKIFAPEHGFRGKADAGEKVKNGIDTKTGLPIVSLYGKNKKPKKSDLEGLDLIIFDIQDVGARFYTYTSTMTYIMEACAENNIPLLILDRPNPNGHYVDGPILQKAQKSFIGLHPVPIIHGLTVAEYARMINGEGWLANGVQCQLYHVECLNYNHKKFYKLPIAPSPNLPNMKSIYLYPSLCLFEGTTGVSIGRGTDKQFQIIGHPNAKKYYTFTPTPKAGAKHPKQEGKKCNGIDLSLRSIDDLQTITTLNLDFILDMYRDLPSSDQSTFFRKDGFFNLLAGNTQLKEQIIAQKSAKEIRKSWQAELEAYKKIRKKYLLYKDFE